MVPTKNNFRYLIFLLMDEDSGIQELSISCKELKNHYDIFHFIFPIMLVRNYVSLSIEVNVLYQVNPKQKLIPLY